MSGTLNPTSFVIEPEKKKRHSIAQAAARQLDAPYAETKETLRKLYDLNIIFPKYRNLVAMSTMYEYLASGRCSELAGADGAYNLYESELRQNIIINKLSMIITKLEDIKQNQYVLYQELKKTDRILSDISGDMKELLSTTHEIADASKIAAFCSQVTAQNTEVLKHIALVNG